jgi:hypothetical protein
MVEGAGQRLLDLVRLEEATRDAAAGRTAEIRIGSDRAVDVEEVHGLQLEACARRNRSGTAAGWALRRVPAHPPTSPADYERGVVCGAVAIRFLVGEFAAVWKGGWRGGCTDSL